MAKLNLRSGSEGPRNDPYHYEEYQINIPNLGDVTVHCGLAQWVEINGETHEAFGDDYDMPGFDAFCKRLTGYSFRQFERFYRRYRSRCRQCGGRDFYCSAGYPGETLTQCSKCHSVLCADQDMSSII